MFLSKLKIIGFKSFPDKTTLNFTEGMTCIVGPNGCGKTNIVDAIRWVLGEQKASILRSNKMEEVIFNGTQKKKPLGFCEVTLTIENNKKLLPIEYDIVEITRRYYRNGDSEYYINKTQCRLKDIHDMFIDTGMSSGAYSVIELKMIESILSQNPTDRRSMIDEASGINNYNKQKAASTRRLISTKLDMDRIFDIMSEVETNVKKLKLQMKRFDRHKVLSRELNSADYMYNKKIINDLVDKIQPLQAALDGKTKFKEAFDEKLRKKESNLEKNQKFFEDTQIELEKNQKKIKEIEELIIKNNQEIIISSEQIAHSKSRTNHFNNEIVIKKDQNQSIQLDIDRMSKVIKSIIPELRKQKSEFDKISTKRIKLEKELSEFKSKKEHHKLEVQDTSVKISSHNNMIDLNNRIATDKGTLINTFKKDIKINLERHDAAKSELDSFLGKFKFSEKLKGKYIVALQDLEKDSNKIQESYRMKIKELDEFKGKIRELSSRIDFYNKILISKDGLIGGNKILSDNISSYNGVLGKVSDMISASDKFMRAISLVLGEYSDYIIVDTLNHAMSITKQFSKDRISFNLIALDQIKRYNILKTGSHLISNIKYDKKFKNLFSLLLGHFILLDSIDLKLDKSNSYITLSGDMVINSGLIKINPNMHNSKISLNLEIETLKREIIRIRNIIIKTEKQTEDIERKQNKIEIKKEETFHGKESTSIIISDLRINIEQKKMIISEAYNQNRSIQVNISNLEKNIVNLRIKNKEISASLKLNLNSIKEMKKVKNLLSNRIQNIETDLLTLRQNIQKKNINLIEISNEKNTLSNRISDQNGILEKIKIDIERYKEEIKKLTDLVEELNLSKSKCKSDLKKNHTNEKNINKIKNKLDSRYSSSYEKFQIHQLEIKDKRVIKEAHIQDINKVLIDIEKMKNKKEFYTLALNDIRIDSIDENSLNKIKNFSPEVLSLIIEKNKKLMERIGPVNMDVDDQHKAEIERCEFLENQYNDLVESKKTLEKAIKTLDIEARKQFESTFEKIKLNFSKTYNMFYEKGKANLELKGEDALDAEIIIKATPPGKSTQSLRMLSGGEKAITAIALLFAIYLVKPSPFCILDEVDAPLDDLNIKRFNSVVKEFSKNSQFIIVTHNKLTMEGADFLYGVTQRQEGISRIVSVNLKDIEEKILT